MATRCDGWHATLYGSLTGNLSLPCSIKKPKTSRYPSLKGTDPKFRRNHRHALHGTAKALVRTDPSPISSSLHFRNTPFDENRDRRGKANTCYRRSSRRASARPPKFSTQSGWGTIIIEHNRRNMNGFTRNMKGTLSPPVSKS